MEVLTLILAANEFKQFRKGGSTLEVTDSVYPVTINMYSANGSQTNSLSNILSGHYLKARFGAFDIKNGPVAQTITVLTLDEGEDGGSRRAPGVVQVVDSGKERSKSNLAFMDSGFVANSPAAFFGTLQLWNPAGSGRRVIVEKITANCTQTTNINFAFTATQAATLRRAVSPKLQGGVSGVSQVRTDNTAASLAASGQIQRAVLANAQNVMDFREPLVINPGAGLVVWADPVGAVYGLFADFELLEEVL